METKAIRILAVIDPTRDDQWALRKAVAIARARTGSKITAFLGIFSDAQCDNPERLQRVELARHRIWLQQILDSFADQGVAIEPVVQWDADWREAVCLAAKRGRYDLVIKQASGRPLALASSDRHLIRSLRGSALLLVKHDPLDELRKVLVAVDFNATDAGHAELNEAIMTLGKNLRGSGESIELHSISAYPEADRFVHPPDVARMLGIARSQAHVRQGRAEEAIPLMANSIGADLVIVGSVGRSGLSGVTIGNTAEKILAGIEADILVIVLEPARERSAA